MSGGRAGAAHRCAWGVPYGGALLWHRRLGPADDLHDGEGLLEVATDVPLQADRLGGLPGAESGGGDLEAGLGRQNAERAGQDLPNYAMEKGSSHSASQVRQREAGPSLLDRLAWWCRIRHMCHVCAGQ
ncbi:hypothetical protein GCM10010518_00150 [Kitasatospora cinereorecta]